VTPSHARYSDFHRAPFNNHRGDVRVSLGATLKAVNARRFPPPWSVEEIRSRQPVVTLIPQPLEPAGKQLLTLHRSGRFGGGIALFEIDWTIVASAVGLLISSFAVFLYARRHRD
jgi:hypothetical protein